MSKIVLKAGKERSLYRLHPWVFSGAIAKIKGDVQEGDVVQVYNSDDEYLATGHYQIGSIAVRVLTFKEEEIGYNFWVERIRQAYLTRVAIGLATNFFLYVFINMAMVLGLIPVVGIPLALISYGGTVILSVMASFGIILSVCINRNVNIGK